MACTNSMSTMMLLSMSVCFSRIILLKSTKYVLLFGRLISSAIFLPVKVYYSRLNHSKILILMV